MTTLPTEAALEVTQADTDLAVRIMRRVRRGLEDLGLEFLHISEVGLPELLARHRLASTSNSALVGLRTEGESAIEGGPE